MMPNKTIYIKDADVPLFERAQDELGESISSLFADFMRERIATLTPVERNILQLQNEIAKKRAAMKKEPALPQFIESEYAEAGVCCGKALESLRTGDIKKAKVFWYAANTYREWAERDLKQTRELAERISQMLKS